MSPMAPEEEDRDTMLRLVGGDDTALNELMDRHASRLFNYLLRCLGNLEDSEEIALESFARVYQHRDRFKPAFKFSTWLYTIATNLLRDHLRYRSRRPVTSLESRFESSAPDRTALMRSPDPSPSELFEKTERSRLVRQAVAELPDDLRIPLVLAEFEGQSHAQIADLLGCSAKAVEMRVYRARKDLKATLAPFLCK
jgi:RNA polymerase sigma-70 factor, ECF subfamily